MRLRACGHCNSFLQAQQMTLQAMSISQQQQQWQKPLENSRPRASSPPQARAVAPTPVPATSPKPKKPPSSQKVAPPPEAPEPPAKAEELVRETNSGGEFGLNSMICIYSASLSVWQWFGRGEQRAVLTCGTEAFQTLLAESFNSWTKPWWH